MIRLDDDTTFDPSLDPSQVYPDDSQFTNYSSSTPLTPYVAAEISAANYRSSSVFLIGDDVATRNLNDFPSLYRNGPLQEGSKYTSFVRAFSNTVPVSLQLNCFKVDKKLQHHRPIVLAVQLQ